VQDLEDTVAIVEQHPGKFALAAAELAERKRFIASVRLRLQVHTHRLAQTERERERGKRACTYARIGHLAHHAGQSSVCKRVTGFVRVLMGCGIPRKSPTS
jgi:hypothetical protein